MLKVRKIPQRQCLGCGEMKDKRSLIRIVRSPEGTLSLDSKGKKPGRGAYVCPNATCLKQALTSKKVEKALGVKLTAEIMESLKEECASAGS